jgi:RimJ/RimL family protein N-acetyltransferase
MTDYKLNRADLIGERVLLRPPLLRDVEETALHLESRAVTRYMSMPHPYPFAQVKAHLRRARSRKWLAANMAFSVVHLQTGKVIGAVGVHFSAPANRSAELGCWLARPYWGEGYTTEAMTLVIEHLFRHRKLQRLSASIWSPNVRSIRLVERFGFVAEGRLRRAVFKNRRWMDVLQFGLLREEWLSIQKTRRSKPTGSAIPKKLLKL